MATIGIVTDSTAYLTELETKELRVKVVPLVINFGGESYPEGSRYSNEEFFRMVAESPVLPTTSQPSAGAFMETFKELLNAGVEDIVGIFISSGLSGTYASAKTAVELLGSQRIHLFDSGFTVSAQRFMVEEAAVMAKNGSSVVEILARLKQIKENTNMYFVVQTLDNLRKGGRIGGAASLIGTLLQVKPILYLNEGKIELFDKVRTKSKAWARVCELLDRALGTGIPYRVSIIHLCSRPEAEELARELRDKYPGQRIDVDEAGQVIGTHVGQGTLGLCFYPGADLHNSHESWVHTANKLLKFQF